MPRKDIIIVNTYPNSKEKLELTKNYLGQLKKAGKDILLISHLPLDSDIVGMVDYFIYDKENFLLPKDKCPVTWFADDKEYIFIHCHRHCYAIVRNMYQSIHYAKSMGYTNFIFTEYDNTLTDAGVEKIQEIFDTLDSGKRGFIFKYLTDDHNSFGFIMKTNLFAFNIDFFLEKIPLVKSVDEWYVTYPYSNSTHTIEVLFMDMLIPHLSDIHVEDKFLNEYFVDSKFDVHSIFETANPVLYNLDDPSRPLLFHVTQQGYYEIFINGKLVRGQEYADGGWLREYFSIDENDSEVEVRKDNKIVAKSKVNLHSIEAIKEHATVKSF